MRVTVGSDNFRVGWKHESVNDHPLIQKRTTCFIKQELDKPNEVLVASGSSDCSKKDNFVKNKGRKYSLARALKAMYENPKKRKLFWDVYLNR